MPPVRAPWQTPNLLTFFISSTAWSSTSFGLLRLSGEIPLALGSALLLPMTVLAFVRPVPLPYSWAAPPEPLSAAHAKLALLLLLALCVYHVAGVAAAGPRLGLAAKAPWAAMARRERISNGSPAGLMGPSLEL